MRRLASRIRAVLSIPCNAPLLSGCGEAALGELGPAGSSCYTAPVTITPNEEDGRSVRYDGEVVVLRRANDVPGAPAERLRWHIEQLSLDWTH